jgi:O-acetylhomoserine/O-acetylserine sulfhydrylase-like pyridoxal-dependent enzyme
LQILKEENTKHTAMKFNTKVIHGGQQHDPTTGAVMPLFFKRQHLLKKSWKTCW